MTAVRARGRLVDEPNTVPFGAGWNSPPAVRIPGIQARERRCRRSGVIPEPTVKVRMGEGLTVGHAPAGVSPCPKALAFGFFCARCGERNERRF